MDTAEFTRPFDDVRLDDIRLDDIWRVSPTAPAIDAVRP